MLDFCSVEVGHSKEDFSIGFGDTSHDCGAPERVHLEPAVVVMASNKVEVVASGQEVGPILGNLVLLALEIQHFCELLEISHLS